MPCRRPPAGSRRRWPRPRRRDASSRSTLRSARRDAVDLPPREPRPGRHPELPLDVVRRVQQHAARRVTVAAGPPRLLQVVLERPRDVGVNHQAHIGLIDAHAERVGGCDHPKLTADEAPLDVLPGLRRQTGVETGRRDLLFPQELGHLFRRQARGAVHDRASGVIRRQVSHQDLVNVREFLALGRHHLELEVRSLGAAVEDLELHAELVPEVVPDVVHDIGLGRRGQAEHRRNRLLPRLLADDAPHVPVVGPEVVPPPRQAVGFVQHPAADLALVQHTAEGPAAELLRRDQHHPRVAEPDPVQRLGPLGHREEPVDGDARADAAGLEARHLVRHECDERRDHHGESSGLVVARQGRDLVAERLAGAGGQNSENMLSRHRRLDDGPLHRAPVLVRRLWTEVPEAEPAEKLLAGVIPLPAPLAGRVAAGGVSQPADQPDRVRELVADPGRHDRVAASYPKPGQGVGQGPAVSGRICDDFVTMGSASETRQLLVDRLAGLGDQGSRRSTKIREETVEPDPFADRRRKPVPGKQPVARSALQGLVLVSKDLDRAHGVERGVVHPSSFERAVLVVLDQMVVGVPREGKRIEPQRIDGRPPQQPQVGICLLQNTQVEADQVVAKQKIGAVGEIVEPRQRRGEVTAVEFQTLAGIRPHCSERADARFLPADFEVQREARGRVDRSCVRRP